MESPQTAFGLMTPAGVTRAAGSFSSEALLCGKAFLLRRTLLHLVRLFETRPSVAFLGSNDA